MPLRSRSDEAPNQGLSRLLRWRPGSRGDTPPPPSKPQAKDDIDVLASRIILPSQIVTDEEMARALHQDRGLKLARQDLWNELSEKIKFADTSRLPTPGGECAALLMAFGARSDVVAAAEDALYDGAVPDPAGFAALEEILEEYPDAYPCALIVALAHIDIAWAWRNMAGQSDPVSAAEYASDHIERAATILSAFDGTDLNAPSLIAARCALFAACDKRGPRVAQEYEKLIALDPTSHRHMRALGRHVLPGYAGGLEVLEVSARRVAVQTQEIWGSGAYAWVYLDALALNRRALNLLDVEFFVEGLHDIVARKQDQHIVNLLTAFCAITMAPKQDDHELPDHFAQNRAAVHDNLDWLLEYHLSELHPLIWSQTLLSPGHGPQLPSRRALVAKGKQTALRIIATRFAPLIEDGSSISFSDSGIKHVPSG